VKKTVSVAQAATMQRAVLPAGVQEALGEAGGVTLGGRRVVVERPRVRTADGSEEVALITYQHFADRDPLTRLVLEQMLPASQLGALSAPASRSARRSRRRRARRRSRRSAASSSQGRVRPSRR
jgi:hypothetical protein